MEKPNLEYVEQLAGGDKSLRKRLIDIIKNEFPEEKEAYYKSLKNKDYKKTEENVHRLKHKIIILGLEENYKIANKFEHDLREFNLDRVEDFDKILIAISYYLKTI
jgi:HPt (histidine-containing phosphotransfer) domain-containing protein